MATQLFKKGEILEVRFIGEDIALADILHHELLKDGSVIFAGVASTHPLLAETVLTIQSKTEPTRTLLESILRAAATVRELMDKTEDSLRKLGG